MIILSYDIEATGLDKQNDRIIEVGLALYSTGQQKVLESTGFLVQPDGVPISPEITEITGITQAACDRFGYPPEQALIALSDFMEHADAIIGHNALRFDKQMTDNAAKRLQFALEDRLWIDTMTDIPGVKGEQLITMCAKMGFVYNAHSAEDDAKAVLELTRRHANQSPEKSFEKMEERAKSPVVILQSHQDRGNNADAKKFKFRWNPNFKIWWKLVKEMDVEQLAKSVPFKMSRIEKEYTLEQLDTDS
jgi:DNA polymerase III alpha subunit (gram-positive type)